MRGFTAGLANVPPDLALGIWEVVSMRDWALLEERVRRVLPFELLRNTNGGRYNVAIVKAALAWQGIDAGDVRPPCAPPDSSTSRDLFSVLQFWRGRRSPPRDNGCGGLQRRKESP
jgi:dihydrodipicolinate synthase/N-acetylneuraminate lyase